MQLARLGKTLAAATAVVAAGLGAPSVALAEKDVFSAKYLNKYCAVAQGQIANTDLDPDNVIYTSFGGFVGSDTWPYDTMETLPLTTTQYVGYDTTNSYPTTVMCKMKSWDALDFYISAGYLDETASASAGSNCNDVSKKVANDVIKQLQKEDPGIQIPEIYYDNVETYAGFQWTFQAPVTSAYISNADGQLHLVGKRLYVERTNPVPFIGPEKKGVDYCQTIAPDYLAKIIRDEVTPPTCDAPPPYGGPPFFGFEPWICSNP